MAFVQCAKEYLDEHGEREARRAFNEDARWKHGSTYVFVDGVAKSGATQKTFVYPPDPSREGGFWGEAIDDFGTDLAYEVYRILALNEAGWTYYSILDPGTGERALKASYLIEIEWNGERAAIGSGVYSADWPGTCRAAEVSAAALDRHPTEAKLREFVRCAAMLLESEGYLAKSELEFNRRWRSGSIYLFALDLLGNQVLSGSLPKINGRSPHEWGQGSVFAEQFAGRDMLKVGDVFGEAIVYYHARNPATRKTGAKLGFVKRVVSDGVPLLVGAGYYLDDLPRRPQLACAANSVTAGAVQTAEDAEAFARCAHQYLQSHGPEEARRAFQQDARWRQGPIYVFVNAVGASGDDTKALVFPPDPSVEDSPWGVRADAFGSDLFVALHHTLSFVNSGWVHYSATNPETGLEEPKATYLIETSWNGVRASIGAGVYARDLPGTCHPQDVNAAGLEADPGYRRLREFVRCAARVVQARGLFASEALSTDPRWNHGAIYVFGLDPETGLVRFSGSRESYAVSGRIEVLFDGRDMLAAAEAFGEVFLHYSFINPATGAVQPKTAFAKLVRTASGPVVVGAGYNPDFGGG